MKNNTTLFVYLMLCTSALLLNNIAEAQSYLWAKSAGGTEDDFGSSLTTDTNGNIIVTGYFYSDSITFGTTTLLNDSAGTSDIFIVKYDINGTLIWAKSIGGNNNDFGADVITDASGNIVLTGSFFSPTIAFGTSTLTNSSSYSDCYTVKYDSNGNEIWAQSAGGSANDHCSGITIDKGGNIIVTGSFYGYSITFGTNTLLNNNGSSAIFTVKYDVSGNVLWANSSVGTDYDHGNSVNADKDDNIIVTGTFQSSSIAFGPYTLANAFANYKDIFVVKYNSSGNVMWAKSAGGAGNDNGLSLATDAGGNIVVIGDFYSSYITFGSTILANSGPSNSNDIFIVKYDSSGNAIWAKGIGAYGSEWGYNITTDPVGNIVTTGAFESPSITFGSTTLTNSSANSRDIYIVKYDSSGNVLWAKGAGGNDFDTASSLTTDATGSIIVSGGFRSPSIAFGTTTLTNISNLGHSDFFIAKLNGVTGLSETEPKKGITIYPNPNTGKFQLSTAGISGIKQIEIYSLPGEKVFSQALHSQQQTLDLQIVAGIYFVKVSDGENTFTHKLIVQ